MAGMHFIGPDNRAQQARSAVNRLRWEIDCALGAGYQVPARDTPERIGAPALGEIAEGIAIYRQILATLDEYLPRDAPERAQLARLLESYREHHQVGR